MHDITLYWKNKDKTSRYFYVNVKALKGGPENEAKCRLIIRHPALAQDYHELIRASAGSIRRYCGRASYEHVQRQIESLVIPAVRELLTDIANDRGPVSIDKLVVPDCFDGNDEVGAA